jgi:pyruvate/2-oxoglutarate/acetoin dehydrogenase E1 component
VFTELQYVRFVVLIVQFFFQWLYRLAVEEVPEDDYMTPLSEAEVHKKSQ